MPRFATIELNSGFVWWIGDADDALQACQRSDVDTGCTDQPGEFIATSLSEIKSTEGGYAVYPVPADYDVQDGQDQEAIDVTAAHRLASYYRRA